MKTMKSLCAIALAGVAVAATAGAAEERGYPGAQCSHSPSTTNLEYSYLGVEVTNLSSASVFCGAAPVVGANVDRIQATVVDRYPTSDVCCSMIVLNADGFAIASAFRCSSGSSGSSQLLSAAIPPNAAGTVGLQCSIPAATGMGWSRVASYRFHSIP